MTTTREYRSTDVGAPVLTGVVGSFSTLMQTVLEGTGGVAYGSTPAAGWTTAFSATNKIALKNSMAAGGTGYHFRFDDGGSGTGGAREAMLRAFSSMSDIDTGTDQMPPTALFANGGPIRKSATLNSTARPWIVIADELTCYVWILCNTGGYCFYGFGDFDSDVPGDNYRAFVAHGYRENFDGNSALSMVGVTNLASPTAADRRGLFLGKGYALTGDPVSFSLPSLATGNAATSGGGVSGQQMGGTASPLADPAAGTGLRVFMPALIGAEGMIRGRMRGLYVPLNNLSAVTDGTYETAPAGVASGSKLCILRALNGGGTGATGALAVETGLSW